MIGEAREQMAPIEAPLPPLGPGCFAGGTLAAGQLFVQSLVRHRGVTGRFDNVVGRGFALVRPDFAVFGAGAKLENAGALVRALRAGLQ